MDNKLIYLQDFINENADIPENPKNGAENFLQKPKEESPIKINPGKALPEKVDAPAEVKNIGQQAKEAILPQVRKAADVREKAGSILGAAVPDLSEVPVPSGGIGLLLFISLFIVFAITPVNGKSGMTRLSLLWGTILGNYTIKKAGSSSASGSSSSDSSSASSPSVPSLSDFLQGQVY